METATEAWYRRAFTSTVHSFAVRATSVCVPKLNKCLNRRLNEQVNNVVTENDCLLMVKSYAVRIQTFGIANTGHDAVPLFVKIPESVMSRIQADSRTWLGSGQRSV